MTVIIDIAMALLLAATCWYCYSLNRRLAALRDGQTDMVKSMSEFDEAAARAEATLAGLQASGVSLGDDLADNARRAETLIGELSVMVNAGDRIATRLESAVKDVKSLRPGRRA